MSGEWQIARKWVPVYAAVSRLRKQYEAAEVYANDEVCFRAATESLIRRLRAGQMASRASRFETFDEAPSGENDDPPPEPWIDGDGYFLVPKSFWYSYAFCNELNREEDWIAGDFEYNDQSQFFGHGGSVLGLEVDEKCLPAGIVGEAPAAESQTGDAKIGGRPPAKSWPDFAEELAVYVHECGIPEGSGHDGQSAMIDAIFARMVQNGKAEPGRGTVQPVVNAVLRRIRSAEN